MKKNILILGLSLAMTGCSILDFDEATGRTKEEVYSYFNNVKGLVTNIYSCLPNELDGIGGALRESATDNSVYVWSSNNIHSYYDNSWSSNNAVDPKWATYYSAIRSCNSFLENYSEENLSRFEWNDTYKEDMSKTRMYIHEVKVLRAYFYFELAKRYGDIPLITDVLTEKEANQVEKAPFKEVVDFIVKECDEAAKELPVSQKDFWGETGRVTKGTALAIKARMLLYAASPLHNAEADKSLWKKAADAAAEIIKMNVYSLPEISKDPLYVKNGGNDILKSAQLIFERRNGESLSFERTNLPLSFENGNTGNVPTQNLVDAFQMKDGSDFDWEKTKEGANPYENRDPRFYKTVLFNGDTWMNVSIDTYKGGKDGEGKEGMTKTGYYLKKYMNETVSLIPSKEVKKPHHFVLYRYAEVLLNYAEAMNEWKGADYKDAEHPLSAREALNQVRKAAGMPDVDSQGNEFTQSIKRERRVELAFEDHRFWDIRRWKIGNQTTKIYGIEIQKEGDKLVYSKKLVETRNWSDKMNLFPIPETEKNINGKLGQNPGW